MEGFFRVINSESDLDQRGNIVTQVVVFKGLYQTTNSRFR